MQGQKICTQDECLNVRIENVHIWNTIMLALAKDMAWFTRIEFHLILNEIRPKFTLQMVSTKCSHFGHVINEGGPFGMEYWKFSLNK
jgi:hypothetical protein